MKKFLKILQVAAGFIPAICFWAIAGYTQDRIFISSLVGMDYEVTLMNAITVGMLAFAMLWAYLWALIGSKFNLSFVYYGALAGVVMPILSGFISSFFTDDGNILSWIYMFTIGLVLYPIGRLWYFASEALVLWEGLSGVFICVLALLSLWLFKTLKKREEKAAGLSSKI